MIATGNSDEIVGEHWGALGDTWRWIFVSKRRIEFRRNRRGVYRGGGSGTNV